MKNQIKFALIQQALLRWENAALIALAILLTAFFPQRSPSGRFGAGEPCVGSVTAITSAAWAKAMYVQRRSTTYFTRSSNRKRSKPDDPQHFLQGLKYRSMIEQMVAQTRMV